MELRRFVGWAALLVALSSPAYAQEAATPPPQLAGVVRTAEAAPVPGATVRLINPQTNQSWISWTDENGKFEFPGIPAGHYRLEIEQLGFTEVSHELDFQPSAAPPLGISIAVAPLEAPKPAAEPGRNPVQATRNNPQGNPPNGSRPPGARGGGQLPAGVTNAIQQGLGEGGFQQVEVTGGAAAPAAGEEPPVQIDMGPLGSASSSDSFLLNGTVGQSVGGGNGGAFGAFGVAGGPGGPGGGMGQQGGGGAGGFGGGQGNTSGVPVAPTPSGAQGGGGFGGRGGGGPRGGGGGGFGQGVGALWGSQRTLRQAVNRIRISVYDRYDNSVWDARPYSLTEANPAKISHFDERVGVSLGGPLRIPKVYDGRDKTFFFVNYQHERQESPVDTFATVPTIPERGGDFSDRDIELYNPFSSSTGPRTPLGTAIPPNMLNSAALGLLKYVPEPNLPGLVDNFHLQTNVPVTSDILNTHVVHTISTKVNMRVGYNFSSTRQQTLVNFPDIGSHQSARNQNVDFGLTENLSAHFIHDSHLNWNRARTQILSNFSYTTDIAGSLGITGISTAPINYGLPQINLTNFNGLADPVPSDTRNQSLRYIDSVIYSHTKHTWRFGGEVRRMQNNRDSDPTPRGAFTFTGLMTGQLTASGQPVAGTGFDFADFLLGLPQATSTQFGSSSIYLRNWGWLGYVQDDWRVHPRFTFEYGLRYEIATPPTELFGHLSNLAINPEFTQLWQITPGSYVPTFGTLPASLVRTDWNNWAPRLGLAWAPKLKLKTIVRAGYSIFYNESIYTQLALSMANQPPWAEAQTRLTTATQLLTLQNGFPPQPPGTVMNTVAVDPNYRDGYAQIWNTTIEEQFTQNYILDITYTGTRGTHLDLLRAPNRAPPGSPLDTDNNRMIINATGFTYDTSGASSIYHALVLRLQKRYSHGLLLQGIYTYGKSIDDASSIGGGAQVVVQNDMDFRAERGLSTFDMRQQFRAVSTYELPFGEKKRWATHGLPEHVLGNLRINVVATMNTGTPYTARVLGSASDNTGTGSNFSERANQIGNPNLPSSERTPLDFFNTAAFLLPVAGEYGDAARNTITGPGSFNINTAVARTFRFGPDGQHRLEARWEIQNLTNTPNFTGLNTVVNSTTYGSVQGTKSMRTMDLNLRLNF